MMLKDTNEMFADDLRTPAYAAGYLNVTLEEDGIEGFLYALQKVARAHGVSRVASGSDMPRESLYRSLSENGNPGIKPLARVLDTLGLRLTITPAVAEAALAQGMTKDELMACPFGAEVPDLHRLIVKEFAAVREETRTQQEAIQREADNLRADVQRLTALTEQMAEALAGQATDREQQPYRARTIRPQLVPQGRE